MDEVEEHVMIALLPITTDWSTLILPHLTLIYSGKIQDHNPSDFNAMAKDCYSLSMLAQPIVIDTVGIEDIGPEDDLSTVITLRPTTELIAMRNFVKQWDRSEWPSYKPHVTIGASPQPQSPFPPMLAFDRLMIGWGEERLVWWLKR